MAFVMRATEKVNAVNEEQELRRKGYLLGSTLGEGSYAKVKSAYSEKLRCKVAIKVINRKKAPKEFQNKFLPRELDVLKSIHHPNLVMLHEILHLSGKVYITMEMAGHGDLLEYIKLRGAIPEDKARVMFKQIVNAVEYMHGVDIVHRDLKCENILLDCHNNIKVSDFGFARHLERSDLSRTFCGSAAYAAPEILQGIPYRGTLYDIWSLGVILYIMVCGSMPYDDSNIKKMIHNQTERKVGFSRSRNITHECKQLIYDMLDADVGTRASIDQVQDSCWLQKLQMLGEDTIEQLKVASFSKVVTIMDADRIHANNHAQAPTPVLSPVPPALMAPPPATPVVQPPSSPGRREETRPTDTRDQQNKTTSNDPKMAVKRPDQTSRQQTEHSPRQ